MRFRLLERRCDGIEFDLRRECVERLEIILDDAVS